MNKLESELIENTQAIKQYNINGKVSDTLEYKGKETQIKGVYLISENPLIIRLSQNKSERIISKESFQPTNILPKTLLDSLGKNRSKPKKEIVKNPELLKILKIFDAGDWSKVYTLSNDKKLEAHYFQSENGLVYDFKTEKHKKN